MASSSDSESLFLVSFEFSDRKLKRVLAELQEGGEELEGIYVSSCSFLHDHKLAVEEVIVDSA
jgi:hypothetical protein